MDEAQIQRIIEAALMASDGPLTVANIVKLFTPGELDEENANKQVRQALQALQEESEQRGVELKRVASGYRYQVRQELSEWVSRLWDEKPPRYTRALLETLALVAYKQPVTRGDIEQVRGVSVSQSIMRTLVERDWIRIVGQREVPGRPSLYGTTKVFLDYFNLQNLDELPPLAEIRALIEPSLVESEETITVAVATADETGDDDATSDEVTAEPTVASETAAESEDTKAATAAAQDDTANTAEVVQLHSGSGPTQ
jgi:segregation and condensation protein B